MNFNIKNTFVMLAGLVLMPMQASAAEDVTVVHTDHLGSPVYYTNADGTLVGQVDYTPYGAEVIADTTDEEVNYTGHVLDRDTDLIYAQARYYDPIAGRFLSADPMGFSNGGAGYFNRYWYVQANPYGNTDPDGRFVISGSVAVYAGLTLAAGAVMAASTPEGREAMQELAQDTGDFFENAAHLPVIWIWGGE